MKSEEQFLNFYESTLKRYLEPLEEFRSKEMRRAKNLNIFVITSLILLIISIISSEALLIFAALFFVVFFLGLQYEIQGKMRKKLIKEYKYNVLQKLLSFLFEDFEYTPRQKIAKSVLDKSRLFPHEIAHIQGEDFMRFRIDETDIMFCEAAAYPPPPFIGKLFRGVFISSSFNKYFSCETYIFPEKKVSLLRRLKFFIHAQKYKVHLEDVEFEKEFLVLSSNQVEARYILTPALMKRLLDYKKKTNRNISFSFTKNRMYCAIPNKEDLFEPAFKEPFDYNFIKKSYDPIKLYTDIVEDLNLNVRIWSKN